MYLIAGLGNPGGEYKNTRHNIGFNEIDFISVKYNIKVNRIKFKGLIGKGKINNNDVILLKPLTYMNLSGESIREVVKFYKIPQDKIVIIYDDVSLEVGKLRIRKNGSAGGHNGIKSIISCLGTDVFKRVKIGIGYPDIDLISYVMGKISKEDNNILNKVYGVCSDALSLIVNDDIDSAMNKFNGIKVE